MLASAVSDQGTQISEKILRAIQVSGKALLPALHLTYADFSLDFAREVLRGERELHAPLILDNAALARAARALVSAASGNIEYMDALLLSDLAKQRKVALTELTTAFAQNERGYLLASQMSTLAVRNGLDGLGQDTAQTLLRLQAASASYIESAGVITKYYSLDGEVAEEGREAKVRRQIALSALLRRAEVASREAAAGALARLGVIPPDARFHYRSAVEQLVHGTLKARLRALNEFWRSTVESRTATMVLRPSKPEPRIAHPRTPQPSP